MSDKKEKTSVSKALVEAELLTETELLKLQLSISEVQKATLQRQNIQLQLEAVAKKHDEYLETLAKKYQLSAGDSFNPGTGAIIRQATQKTAEKA
jgi:hypothetical protein